MGLTSWQMPGGYAVIRIKLNYKWAQITALTRLHTEASGFLPQRNGLTKFLDTLF